MSSHTTQEDCPFVKKQRRIVRHFKTTLTSGLGAGESALFVGKQLTFYLGGGQWARFTLTSSRFFLVSPCVQIEKAWASRELDDFCPYSGLGLFEYPTESDA